MRLRPSLSLHLACMSALVKFSDADRGVAVALICAHDPHWKAPKEEARGSRITLWGKCADGRGSGCIGEGGYGPMKSWGCGDGLE